MQLYSAPVSVLSIGCICSPYHQASNAPVELDLQCNFVCFSTSECPSNYCTALQAWPIFLLAVVVALVIFLCTIIKWNSSNGFLSLLGFQSLFLHTGSVEFWLGLLLCQQVLTMFLPGLGGSAQLHSSSWNLMCCCSL